MIADFMEYRVLKSLRKAFWLPYARVRASAAKQKAPNAGRTAYGVEMLQRWKDRTFVYCHGGIYGRFLADELEQRKSPFTFVDIGANQGLYSLIAARNPACLHAIAFEPVAATHDVLSRNIIANRLEQRVTAHHLGVSDRTGQVEIYIPENHSGMASLSAGQSKYAVAGCHETINVIDSAKLNELLDGEGSLVVKVDVEGLEATVIEQLLACAAAARVDTVFYEVDTRWCNGAEISAMLAAAGLTEQRRVGFGHHFDVIARRPSRKGH